MRCPLTPFGAHLCLYSLWLASTWYTPPHPSQMHFGSADRAMNARRPLEAAFFAAYCAAFSFLSRRRFRAERVSAAGVRCCMYCTGDRSLPPGVISHASVQCACVGVSSTVVGCTAGRVRGRPPRRCSAADACRCGDDGGSGSDTHCSDAIRGASCPRRRVTPKAWVSRRKLFASFGKSPSILHHWGGGEFFYPYL